MLLLLILFLPFSSALNVTVNEKALKKFRTGEIRTVGISFTDIEQSAVKSLNITCLEKSVCEVLWFPPEIDLSVENQTEISIELKAVFIGITDLVVKVDAEEFDIEVKVLIPKLNHYARTSFIFFIAIFVIGISFMMGTQLELTRIQRIFKTPIGPLTGFFCQFTMMPMIGFLLATFVLPDGEENLSVKLALFAISTCPGGGKSSFWTILFGGNLDLSISMTFTQTIAALFMMPLWMTTLGKHFTSQNVEIPFRKIIESLIAIVIPTSIGMAAAYYRPENIKTMEKWIKKVSFVAMFVITIWACCSYYYIIWIVTWRMVFCGCALPWLGYATAFLVAKLFRQNFKDCVTIAIETGIQNIGIAVIMIILGMEEPLSDIAVTIIFLVALMTDKPLIMIWIINKTYAKYFKRDTVAVLDESQIKDSIEIDSGSNPVDSVDVAISVRSI